MNMREFFSCPAKQFGIVFDSPIRMKAAYRVNFINNLSNYSNLQCILRFPIDKHRGTSASSESTEFACQGADICLVNVDINIEEYLISKSSTLYDTSEVANQV